MYNKLKKCGVSMKTCVYLLQEQVPPRYAVVRTNKRMVDKADCLIVGIVKEWGGAWTAMEYAKKQGKRIINICKS